MIRMVIAWTLFFCGSLWSETRYYLVEGALELPTGRRVGTSLSLAKRTADRTEGKIEEVVLSMRGQEPALETTTIIRIDGDKATLSSAEGGFSGKGKLLGPEWAWNRMTFSLKMDQGTIIEGEDEFATDSIAATKRVLSPDGKLQIVIRESGRAISQPLYDLLRSRLKSK